MSTTNSRENLEPEAFECRHKRRARPYQFQGATADRLCVVCAIIHRWVIYRALSIALLGMIPVLIVQDHVVLTDSVRPLALLKVGLTFVLLYSVSTYPIVSSRRVLKMTQDDQHD